MDQASVIQDLSYRGLRRDLRPALAAVLRAAEVPRAFRMAIVPLVALRELAGFGFVVVDRFLVVAFFFGDAAADFFWVVRFLAAPIAAPERPPITVPTTGAPSADPATAPATAPHSRLDLYRPCLPPQMTQTTLAFVSRAVNKRSLLCTDDRGA
jgi:hypothetical protein